MSASVPMTAATEARDSALEKETETPLSPIQVPVADPEKAEQAQTTDEEAGPLEPRRPAVEVKQKWNSPRRNKFKFLTCIYSFIVMGMNDGAVGALLPYMETYYGVTYTVISLVFLAPFVGYLFAALLNNIIHHRFGQRGVAVLGPLCRLVGYIPIAFHPPYGVLPVLMLFPGFGNGIEDSAWNAWIGNMESANELLGFLHGAYGLGATIGPLIATAMVAKAGLQWYTFFYVLIGCVVLEAILAIWGFWDATGAAYRETHLATTGGTRTTTRTVLRDPIVWLVAFFLLGYVGAEVSLGGWIVTFMLRVRNAEPFAAGLTVTFFWLGLTVGRVLLGFITGRIGEKLAITIYLLLCLGLQLLYWLVPSFVASAVFVSFLGFFLGPLFPAAIVAATKLLPTDYHVSAIGFAAAFGGGGAAVFPFVVGAIAESKGVEVLQPTVVAILAFILLMWWGLPGGLRSGGLEYAREHHHKVGHEMRATFHWLQKKSGKGE